MIHDYENGSTIHETPVDLWTPDFNPDIWYVKFVGHCPDHGEISLNGPADIAYPLVIKCPAIPFSAPIPICQYTLRLEYVGKFDKKGQPMVD